SNQCINNNSFSFINNSSIQNNSSLLYQWSFGDGNQSTQKNPIHAYTSNDTFTVQLKVSSSFGCIDSLSKTTIVNLSPKAKFSINDSSQCLDNNLFIFKNLSTDTIENNTTYHWNFGDGSPTENSFEPQHSFTQPGTYTITLLIDNNQGQCADSTKINITIFPKPNIDFSISDSNQCINNNSFAFINNSSILNNSSLLYQWNFGDGNKSSQKNPIHAYTTTGIYNVQLKASSSFGCIDSLSKTTIVNLSPKAKFSINDSSQCFSGNIFYTSNLSKDTTSSVSYIWEFGDGMTENSINAIHNYINSGRYEIKLKVINENGCEDSSIVTTIIYPKAEISFITNSDSLCSTSNQFIFTNNSIISSGTLSYIWKFGDGTTSVVKNPIKNYINPGNYISSLTVRTSAGCVDSLTKLLVVNISPKAKFSINDTTQCFNGNNFQFNNTSTDTTTVTQHLWKFGDGNTSALANPSYNYSNPGTYTVTLYVTNDNSCTDSTKINLTVYPKPKASFTINKEEQCKSNNNFKFTNTSSITSGTIKYIWDFGDGSTSNNANPSYIYKDSGRYTVRLTVISDKDCIDTISKVIIVQSSADASFGINLIDQCAKTNKIEFLNNTVTNGQSTTYKWNFGDGTTSDESSPTKTYSSVGTYNVILSATTSNGCIDTAIRSVTIFNYTRSSFFASNSQQCLLNNSFQFNNTSTPANPNNRFEWDFGDGSVTSSQLNPIYKYNQRGNFTVKLISINPNGCRDTSSRIMSVFPSPVVSFTSNDLTQCFDRNQVKLNSTSSVDSGTLNLLWKFGDGTQRTSKNPNYSYSDTGTYNGKLIVTTNIGCQDSVGFIVRINPSPSTLFEIDQPIQCFAGNIFTLTNKSLISSGQLSYFWEFGDGKTSTIINPTYGYNREGIYVIKLTATSQSGCGNSTEKFILIQETPQTAFSVNRKQQCFNENEFVFLNSSTITDDQLTYKWHFGDNDSSELKDPTHRYLVSGTYIVTLTSYSSYGCSSVYRDTITVYESPVSSFMVNDSIQCFKGNSFSFDNLSTLNSGPIKYTWNFGDSTLSFNKNASKSYNKADSFTVSLITESEFGCIDTARKVILVLPTPSISIVVDSSKNCLNNNEFVFSNSGTNQGRKLTYLWNFGDNSTSSDSVPKHVFVSPGDYIVSLKLIDSNACSDSATITIKVKNNPTVQFDIDDPSQCIDGNVIKLTNNTDISIIQDLEWNFGNGQISKQNDPSISYGAAGNYDITLTIVSRNGCISSLKKSVVIYERPAVSFSVNSSIQCLTENLFAFTNTSSITSGTLTYSWNFGNGNSSGNQNPTYAYPNEGNYTVTLTATSSFGCSDSAKVNIAVKNIIKPSFTVNNKNQCISGNSFVLTNTTPTQPEATTYDWFLVDANGSTTINPNPNYIFTQPGNYTIKLIATSASGCKDSTSTDVTVYPKPTVAFTANNATQCLAGNAFTFTNTSSITSGTLTYSWNFGNGNSSGNQNPTYSYPNEGNYTVTLTATSAFGCSDSAKVNIAVKNIIKPSFTVNNKNQCISGNSFILTNTTPTQPEATTYDWFLVDANGSTTINPNPNYTFTQPGNYTIKLIATSASGCKDSTSTDVTVYPKPTVAFTANNATQCLAGNAFTFTNTSSITSGSLTYTWNLGNGVTTNNNNTSYLYAYPNEGNYTVTLTATSAFGCSDSAKVNIAVKKSPVAAFSINDTIQVLGVNNFIFTNRTTTNGDNVSYFWRFGNGTTSTAENPSLVYGAEGTYTVTLIATSQFGCIDSTSIDVTVNASPNISFTVNNNKQ
ncbi:MAG: PKD domain-containing protein, partial [Chitinophagia bacterium]